ncbi:hypothetical protein LTR28_007403 [Elasticomyces elasticus]|nr:hypothetical protein LTR28_007403 [Elasticomyces elasticus]
MRPFALLPVCFMLTAMILSFLCVFAGSKKGFMDDYHIVLLNTSRIGSSIFNTSSTHSGDNVFTTFIHNITDGIENELSSGFNSLAKQLGVHDCYSAHILDYCEGFFSPTPVPNATFSVGKITMNVTKCSNRTALYHFDPTQTLQRELNNSGHSDISLTDLHWPSAVDNGLAALRVAQRVAFVLYCIAIGMSSFALLISLISVFLAGRLSASINILVSFLAFLAIGLASAITTVVAVKAEHAINNHGAVVSISASKGIKFLILTWVATGLTLSSALVWYGECVIGRRKASKDLTSYTGGAVE